MDYANQIKETVDKLTEDFTVYSSLLVSQCQQIAKSLERRRAPRVQENISGAERFLEWPPKRRDPYDAGMFPRPSSLGPQGRKDGCRKDKSIESILQRLHERRFEKGLSPQCRGSICEDGPVHFSNSTAPIEDISLLQEKRFVIICKFFRALQNSLAAEKGGEVHSLISKIIDAIFKMKSKYNPFLIARKTQRIKEQRLIANRGNNSKQPELPASRQYEFATYSEKAASKILYKVMETESGPLAAKTKRGKPEGGYRYLANGGINKEIKFAGMNLPKIRKADPLKESELTLSELRGNFSMASYQEQMSLRIKDNAKQRHSEPCLNPFSEVLSMETPNLKSKRSKNFRPHSNWSPRQETALLGAASESSEGRASPVETAPTASILSSRERATNNDPFNVPTGPIGDESQEESTDLVDIDLSVAPTMFATRQSPHDSKNGSFGIKSSVSTYGRLPCIKNDSAITETCNLSLENREGTFCLVSLKKSLEKQYGEAETADLLERSLSLKKQTGEFPMHLKSKTDRIDAGLIKRAYLIPDIQKPSFHILKGELSLEKDNRQLIYPTNKSQGSKPFLLKNASFSTFGFHHRDQCFSRAFSFPSIRDYKAASNDWKSFESVLVKTERLFPMELLKYENCHGMNSPLSGRGSTKMLRSRSEETLRCHFETNSLKRNLSLGAPEREAVNSEGSNSSQNSSLTLPSEGSTLDTVLCRSQILVTTDPGLSLLAGKSGSAGNEGCRNPETFEPPCDFGKTQVCLPASASRENPLSSNSELGADDKLARVGERRLSIFNESALILESGERERPKGCINEVFSLEGDGTERERNNNGQSELAQSGETMKSSVESILVKESTAMTIVKPQPEGLLGIQTSESLLTLSDSNKTDFIPENRLDSVGENERTPDYGWHSKRDNEAATSSESLGFLNLEIENRAVGEKPEAPQVVPDETPKFICEMEKGGQGVFYGRRAACGENKFEQSHKSSPQGVCHARIPIFTICRTNVFEVKKPKARQQANLPSRFETHVEKSSPFLQLETVEESPINLEIASLNSPKEGEDKRLTGKDSPTSLESVRGGSSTPIVVTARKFLEEMAPSKQRKLDKEELTYLRRDSVLSVLSQIVESLSEGGGSNWTNSAEIKDEATGRTSIVCLPDLIENSSVLCTENHIEQTKKSACPENESPSKGSNRLKDEFLLYEERCVLDQSFLRSNTHKRSPQKGTCNSAAHPAISPESKNRLKYQNFSPGEIKETGGDERAVQNKPPYGSANEKKDPERQECSFKEGPRVLNSSVDMESAKQPNGESNFDNETPLKSALNADQKSDPTDGAKCEPYRGLDATSVLKEVQPLLEETHQPGKVQTSKPVPGSSTFSLSDRIPTTETTRKPADDKRNCSQIKMPSKIPVLVFRRKERPKNVVKKEEKAPKIRLPDKATSLPISKEKSPAKDQDKCRQKKKGKKITKKTKLW